MTTPCAIVTRPEHEALAWVAALQRRGIAALALPLIGIGAAPDAAALQAARQHLSDYRAIMLVSGNAAQQFFEPNTALALMGRALQAGCRQHDAVVLAAVQFAQTGIEVAAQWLDAQVGALRQQQRLAAQARRPDHRALRQISKLGVLRRDEGIARVVAL